MAWRGSSDPGFDIPRKFRDGEWFRKETSEGKEFAVNLITFTVE